MAQNIIEYFKANCSNFIYIFIADDAARKVFGNAPVILQKRKNQINYVVRAAQLSKYTYNQLRDVIAQEIIKVYGKTPGAVLLDLAEGKNVYSNSVVRSAIAGTPHCGAKIDKSGYPVGADTNKYIKVSNSENGSPVGVFDLSNGKQVSYYQNNKWYAGETPASDKQAKNLWVNNISWSGIVAVIINLIGYLFGVRKAQNIAAYQSDGWYGVTQNTTQYQRPGGGDIVPIAMLAVIGYMLVSND